MDGLAIAASLSELRPAVEGAFIRTAYQPTRDLIILRVSGAGSARILISPKSSSVHLTELDIPNPRKPSNFAMLLRKHLRGGRIVSARQVGWDRIVIFSVERRDGSRMESVELIAELAGLRGNVLVVRDGMVLGASRRDARNLPGRPYRPLTPQAKLDPREVRIEDIKHYLENQDPERALAKLVDGVGRQTASDILSAEGGEAGRALSRAERAHELLSRMTDSVQAPDACFDPVRVRATFYRLSPPAVGMGTFSAALDRAFALDGGVAVAGSDERATRVHLLRALGRRARTAEKLRDWLDAAAEAERLRHHADLLLTHQSDLASGADRVTVIDPASQQEVAIRLDSSLGPVENAQRLYERAKRLRRGRPHVENRLRRFDREIDEIQRAIAAVDAAEPLPAAAVRFLPEEAKVVSPEAPAPRARRFTVGEFTVLVGRDAKENDRLLREAAPDDVWMHARGVAGSHVVIRRGGRREIPESVLREAARLAACYSKAKSERSVDVSAAAAKHVRKPKGAPPGMVIVENEDTLTVDPGLRERQ